MTAPSPYCESDFHAASARSMDKAANLQVADKAANQAAKANGCFVAKPTILRHEKWQWYC